MLNLLQLRSIKFLNNSYLYVIISSETNNFQQINDIEKQGNSKKNKYLTMNECFLCGVKLFVTSSDFLSSNYLIDSISTLCN